jgi:hypothetical protein
MFEASPFVVVVRTSSCSVPFARRVTFATPPVPERLTSRAEGAAVLRPS